MTYGCYNRREYKQVLTVQNGTMRHSYNFGHHFEVANKIEVPFRMAKDCQYTKTELGQLDSRCNGCKWRQDDKEEL